MMSRKRFDLKLLAAPHAFSSQPKRGMEFPDFRSLGMVLPMQGGARGIATAGDVLTQTADGRDLNGLWAEFQATVALRNERRQRIIDFLTYPVTKVIDDVPQIGTDNFEEASEFGVPKSIRPNLAYFSMAFDFKWYDLAARFTWLFLAEATSDQVEAVHGSVLEADNRLVFDKVLKTVFNNVNLSATIKGQNYTVYKFYNNDGTVPPEYNSTVHAGTHNHYLTTGAATLDSRDVEDMADHLKHHGYSSVTGSRVVLMVNSAEARVIRTWRANVVNNNAQSALYDFIPAIGSAPFILPAQGMVGTQPPAQIDGLNVIGQYGTVLVVEEDYIPSGYLLMFATGGDSNLLNPVGIREHANASLRGLRLMPGNQAGYPLIESFYGRGFGTGVRQRGAGVVFQLTAAGTYAIPTAYV